MQKRRASKLKVQLPAKIDETETQSDINRTECSSRRNIPKRNSYSSANSCEYEKQTRLGESNPKAIMDKRSKAEEIFNMDSKDKEEREEQELYHKDSQLQSGNKRDDESELEAKAQNVKNVLKSEPKEEDSNKELSDEETPSADTYLDDNGCQAQVHVFEEEKEGMVKMTKETDEIIDESNKNSDVKWYEDELMSQPPDDASKGVLKADISQAKFVLRNITSRIPLFEETAIRRGVKLSGPPLEFATTHLDEYARKFRWPQHVHNLKNTDFSQDPTEIFEDFELMTECDLQNQEPVSRHRTEQNVSMESAFAQVPRPIIALAAGALRRSSQKRKRTCSENEELSSMFPSAHMLLSFARVGGHFSDQFAESLLTANGKALQGIGDVFEGDMDKRCWSSLPTKKKPIANWRFVLEHVRRTMGSPQWCSDAVNPPMKQETLERITNRLKNLYGCTTHDEDDIFERAPFMRKTNTPESNY